MTLLTGLGWLPLDSLLDLLGLPETDRWAVTDERGVLAALDLHLSEPEPDEARRVLRRCRRRGEVRLREVLELRALLRSGAQLPPDVPVLRQAAGLEAHVGGDMLSQWLDRSAGPGPALLPGWGSAGRRGLRRVRSRLGRRLVVGFSGVDGAGKSTLVREVLLQLRTAGVPAGTVWARPGLGLDRLDRLAGFAKRALGQDSGPAVRTVAAGSRLPRSRQGLVGWSWTVLVTSIFLIDARRQHLRERGVLLYDRHALDALVTLDVAYRGTSLRLPRALVRHLIPAANASFYLDVPADVACGRKSDEIFGSAAVVRQLELYTAHREQFPDLHLLDATRPVPENVREVLRTLTSGGGAAPRRRAAFRRAAVSRSVSDVQGLPVGGADDR
ncbi:hypothetical protein [Geodermatophilus sp. URMC 60]